MIHKYENLFPKSYAEIYRVIEIQLSPDKNMVIN